MSNIYEKTTKTNNKYSINVDEGVKSYDIYKIDVDELKLNPYNGRFKSAAKDKGILPMSLSEEDKQEMLKEQTPRKFEVLKKAVDRDGQLEPLILNKEGLVIDGNSRLTIMREAGASNADVIILQNNYLTEAEISSVETKIQFRRASRIDYTPLNLEIKIYDMYIDFIKRQKHTKTNAINEIMDMTGYTKAKINDAINKNQFIINAFDLIDKDFKYKWFDKTSDQIKSTLKFINATFNKKNSKVVYWYNGNDEARNTFIKSVTPLLLAKAKAVGGIRELFSLKGKENLITDKDNFDKFILDLNSKFSIDYIIALLKNGDISEATDKTIPFLKEWIGKRSIQKNREKKEYDEKKLDEIFKRVEYSKPVIKITEKTGDDHLRMVKSHLNIILNKSLECSSELIKEVENILTNIKK